ncbi:MAG: hypothetical protein L0099_04200 [Acidobacteria bacterium]|nr:hypothetical protein [Acidobacteriota bacterium]
MDEAPAYRSPQEDLKYIRHTLESATRFSSVSGQGLMLVGFLTMAAVAVNLAVTGAPWDPGAEPFAALTVWLALLAIGLAAGVWSTERKARRAGKKLWSPALANALWAYGAGMALGALLSLAALRIGHLELLPAIWLGCYGAAMTAAGVLSVSPLRWMGISFLMLAVIAVLSPPHAGLALLTAGFGWLHVGFGAWIHWRHVG